MQLKYSTYVLWWRVICQRLIYVNTACSFAFPAHLFSIFLNLFRLISPNHCPNQRGFCLIGFIPEAKEFGGGKPWRVAWLWAVEKVLLWVDVTPGKFRGKGTVITCGCFEPLFTKTGHKQKRSDEPRAWSLSLPQINLHSYLGISFGAFWLTASFGPFWLVQSIWNLV